MNRFFACLLTAAALCAFAGTSSRNGGDEAKPEGTAGPYRLKVTTNLMQVRAVVTDRKGRIVENLGKEDFELLENDQPQEISFFTVSRIEPGKNLPAEGKTQKKDAAAGISESEAGAVRARRIEDELHSLQDRLREPPVRTTLLYVDNLHLSFSSLNWIKQALHRFINEQMTDQDVVALGTSHTLGFSQQFTRDRNLLNYAVEQIRYGSYDSDSYMTPNLAARVYDGDLEATRVAVEYTRQEDNIPCPCSHLLSLLDTKVRRLLYRTSYSRRNTLSIIEKYAEQMADLPGKRMIVLFSDGFSMRESDGGFDNSALRSVVNRAAYSGVVIYSIDAAGVRLPPTINASRAWSEIDDPQRRVFIECVDMCRRLLPPGGDQDRCLVGCLNEYPQRCPEVPEPSCYPPQSGLLTAYVEEYEQESLNGMHFLAEETGGKMYWGTNNLNESLERAFDANRFYYVLSYYVPEREDKNLFRELEVRVRNHPEYTVRAPKGFSLSDLTKKAEEGKDETPQQRLIAAMRNPLPVTDLGVSVRADYIETETDDKQVSLTVYFEGDSFRYRRQDQRRVVELEIISVINDSSGKQVDGISARVEGKLTPAGVARAKDSGYRFSRRLPLKPGIYQVRIGVREEGSDRIGTASTWVEVPEVGDNRLEMSSLILSNPLTPDPPAGEESVQVGKLEQTRMVQGVPMYAQDDLFYYVFRVHRPMDVSGNSGLEVMREVLQSGKPIVKENWKAISAKEINPDSKGWFDLDGEVDISGLDSGVYELRVSIKAPGKDKSVQRSLSFGIL